MDVSILHIEGEWVVIKTEDVPEGVARSSFTDCGIYSTKTFADVMKNSYPYAVGPNTRGGHRLPYNDLSYTVCRVLLSDLGLTPPMPARSMCSCGKLVNPSLGRHVH